MFAEYDIGSQYRKFVASAVFVDVKKYFFTRSRFIAMGKHRTDSLNTYRC